MGRALKKLHSQQGASILLALLFFLVCAFVGAVILGSATTNAQKVQERREDQQAYYAVSSAARLLRDAMNDSVFEGWENKVEYDCPYGGHGDSGSHLCTDTEFLKEQEKNLLFEAAWPAYCSQLRFSHEFPDGVKKVTLPYTIDFAVKAGEELPEVVGKLIIDRDYNVTILLCVPENGVHVMTLSFPAIVQTVGPEMVYEMDAHTVMVPGTDGAGNPTLVPVTEFYTKTTTTYRTRIAWEPAVISKGDTTAEEVTPGA